MSINSFCPELLMQVLSHLLDVRGKIRLERVSRRFRDCIRHKDSWKHNAVLEMALFGSDRQLRSFLSRAIEIKVLSCRDCGLLSGGMACVLWQFDKKLKIESFLISPTTTPCPANTQLVGCCLGKFDMALTTVDFGCCQGENCDLLKLLGCLLPQCSNLKHLTLRSFDDRVPLGQVADNQLVRALIGMDLETLHLVDFALVINWQTLAEVYNSAQEHPLRSMHLENTRGGIARFEFDKFFKRLEPKAADAIESITLLDIRSTFQNVLGDLPKMLPHLSRINICESLAYAEDVRCFDQAIRRFMWDCDMYRRPHPIQMQLKLFAKPAFTEMLWWSVDGMPRWICPSNEAQPNDWQAETDGNKRSTTAAAAWSWIFGPTDIDN